MLTKYKVVPIRAKSKTTCSAKYVNLSILPVIYIAHMIVVCD